MEARLKRAVAFALFASAALGAQRAAPAQAPSDPVRWFATRAGLIRIYQQRGAPGGADAPGAGASCEVLESRPRDASAAGTMRETCTLIVGRKPQAPTRLSYELRRTGIYQVGAQPEGGAAQRMERLVLPAPLGVGSSWHEERGEAQLSRSVQSAGSACAAAGRRFADCLVLAVTRRSGGSVTRFTETYAAGVGLVEDSQWQLIDVQGL